MSDKEQNDVARCVLCGEPMPKGEEMLKFHGYSGPCPAPPLPVVKKPTYEELEAKNAKLQWMNAMKLLVEIRRAAAGRYLSPDLLDRVRLMIEEHDGMISVEEVDAELKLPEGFGDERKQETDSPCPWCGAESKWSNGPHQRFICGSGVDAGWVPDRNQSDRCKLNCAKQENEKLREELDEIISMRDAAEMHVIRLRAENAKLREELDALRVTAPYRVENQQPARVEQGEWRSENAVG